MRASSVVERESTRIISRLHWPCYAPNLPPQDLSTRNAAVQALPGHHTDHNTNRNLKVKVLDFVQSGGLDGRILPSR